MLRRPSVSPYLPADVPLPAFCDGRPCGKLNLFEGYRPITEHDMLRLGTGLYLSGPSGKVPVLYDPLHKFRPPAPRRASR